MSIYKQMLKDLGGSNNPQATGAIVGASALVFIAQYLESIADSLSLIAASQARQTVAIESAAEDDSSDYEAPGEVPVAAEGIQAQTQDA